MFSSRTRTWDMQSPTGATSDFWRQKSNDLAGSAQSTPDIINIYVREFSLHL